MEKVPVKSCKGISDKSITGNAATESAFWRLSLVLKEIAESAVNDKEEAAGVKSYTRVPKMRNSKKTTERGCKNAIVKASARGT